MSESQSEPIAVHGLRFEVAGMSEQGPRTENQDAFTIDRFTDTGIVAVADGMGGERSGRLAADTALQAVLAAGPVRSLDDLRRAVRTADATVVRAAGENPDAHGGMGCAIGVLALANNSGDGIGWIGAHVGDVRILSRSPDGTVRLETRDHTPAFAKWEAGEITLDEIPDTAGANRLQRAVGRGGEADASWMPARPGWSWLLVSDGVYKSVRLDELSRILESPSAAEAVELIRRKVEERGPEDNYTAVLIRALEGGASSNTRVLPAQSRTMDQTRSAPFNPPARRSGLGALATLLALLALAGAGYAIWSGRQASGTGVQRTEMDQLRAEVDSLRLQVQQLSSPFGPTAGGAAPVTPGDAPPLPRAGGQQ
ncbi:MAG: protein phosphatase 2C domain-containing protein [Gemmatimonadetes bacterium]|nr:protein phosphatase 2C domain-containing protein [Gemmatimonadota bacterium]